LPAASAVAVFTGGGRIRVPAEQAAGSHDIGPRALWQLMRGYYRDRLAWVALLVFSALLAYAGGAVMFWFHAVYLGEGGPAISPWLHWLLDSTAGFVGLTPALAVIMPFAASLSARLTAVQAALSARYVLLIGTLFAFVTAPGPIMHNALVGRGTWVANHVTALLGNGHPLTAASHHIPPLVDMAGQVAVGLPTYIAMAGLALLVVRVLARRAAEQGAAGQGVAGQGVAQQGVTVSGSQ
jgi:hypothetical protein